jgi:hypothetical protein
MYAKFEKSAVYISLKSGLFQCIRPLFFTLDFKMADFLKGSIFSSAVIYSAYSYVSSLLIFGSPAGSPRGVRVRRPSVVVVIR